MAKLKVKKHSTVVDMTAMSDVTVLLLTFFMMTSTFLEKEPVTVTTPASVSETEIPETNLLTILVDENSKVFLGMKNKNDMEKTLIRVGEDYGIEFTADEIQTFRSYASFGVPVRYLKTLMSMPTEAQDLFMQELNNPRVGIPSADGEVLDETGAVISSDNEFKRWITHAMAGNKEMRIAIKADKSTEYPVVKKVMDNLREMNQNRYLLITTLKTASNE